MPSLPCQCIHANRLVMQGYHGDTSTMFFAGEPTPRARWLSEVTKEAMLEGIKQCGPGVQINAVGKVGCPLSS